MKQISSLGFIAVIAALAVAGSFGLVRQRQKAIALRNEIELARIEGCELVRLRAENQRLREKQIPPADLERLRADHAALPRLRSEMEALRAGPDRGQLP